MEDEKATRLFGWTAWIGCFSLLMLWSQPSPRLIITLLVIATVYFLIQILTAGKE